MNKRNKTHVMLYFQDKTPKKISGDSAYSGFCDNQNIGCVYAELRNSIQVLTSYPIYNKHLSYGLIV